ncbi:MAG: hypothetical protein EOO15_18920 [Chitinophagaceae bacterium]|nr:MAG: hypothetical protein EOO15_18920 [Chitinophagaceae bacterium]
MGETEPYFYGPIPTMPPRTRPTRLFSTILFVDGMPVGYELVPSGNTVRLMPDSLLAITGAPEIEATHVEAGWTLKPELDRDLADQVLEDLGRFLVA